MALEEFNGKADQVSEPGRKEEVIQGETALDPRIQALMEAQQKQIAELQSKINQGSSSDPLAIASAVAAAVAPLYQQMSSQDVTDKETGQFRFKKTAASSDPTDALPKEEWVSFVSYMSFNVITSDLRNGVEVPAPIKPIKFIYDSTKRIPRGKDTEMVHICVYTCRSKKELEWLRSHTCFGVTFFDNIKGTLADDAKLARKMANLIMSLRGMNIHELMAMAKNNDLTNYQGLDADDLRATIAYQMAQKQNQLEIENQKMLLNDIALEQEFKKNITHE